MTELMEGATPWSADGGPVGALCLHGFPDHAPTWEHLMPELAAAGYHVVAPWLRGYAPTGLAPLSGRNPILRRGYLLGSYVAQALFYVPDVYATPIPDPIALIQNESDPIIDVAEGPDGSVYFASGFVIYKLIVPSPASSSASASVSSATVAVW